MKKIIFLLMLTIAFSAAAQEEVVITKEGFQPIVVTAEGVSAKTLYDRAKFEIAKTFKNPDYVTKADIEGEILRFNGIMYFKGSLTTEGNYYYTCELEFRDGRYKISFFNVHRTKMQDINSVFNKEGELRKMEFYKTLYKNFVEMTTMVHLNFKKAILKSDQTDW